MKRAIIVAAVLVALVLPSFAEEDFGTGASFSFAIAEQADALAAWAGYGSPLLFGSAQVRVELGGAVMPYLSGGVEAWAPFWAVRAGLAGYGDWSGGVFRPYGTGGVLFAFPGSELSDARYAFGGWGAFGFEFLAMGAGVFYLELGTVGSEATAELAGGSPRFLNGFCTTVGLRFYP